MTSNTIPDVTMVKTALQSYLDLFRQYSTEILGDDPDQANLDLLRMKLQRMEPRVTSYLIQIIGDGAIVLGSLGQRDRVPYRALIGVAVLGGNNELPHNFREFDDCVSALLNQALGNIDAGLWPPASPNTVHLAGFVVSL